jgi:hypothetical protein
MCWPSPKIRIPMPHCCLLLRGYRVDGAVMSIFSSCPEWRWRPSPGLATCGSKTRPTNCSGKYATSRFKEPHSAMRARITLKTVTKGTIWSKTKGAASTSRCDHCREELKLGAHRYWHMQFCSAACMSAYEQRLAPETKVKICGLDVLPLEDQPGSRAA